MSCYRTQVKHLQLPPYRDRAILVPQINVGDVDVNPGSSLSSIVKPLRRKPIKGPLNAANRRLRTGASPDLSLSSK